MSKNNNNILENKFLAFLQESSNFVDSQGIISIISQDEEDTNQKITQFIKRSIYISFKKRIIG